MVTVQSVVKTVVENGIDEAGFTYAEMFKDLGIDEYHLVPYSFSRYLDGTFFEGFEELENVVEDEDSDKEFTFDSNRIGKIWYYLDYTLIYLGTDGKAEASFILFR
jgi:hypothetical protein